MRAMTITRHGDGTIAPGYGTPGPYLTLTRQQWRDLLTEIRKAAP
jgi:hypothetical protein